MEEFLEKYLKELFTPRKEIINSQLRILSHITKEGLELFIKKWRENPEKRRLEVLERLVLVTSDYSSINYDDIFKFCLSDSSSEVRVKALEGLYELEDTQLARKVIKMLQEDEDEKVRASAASFLAPFALKAELEELSPFLAGLVERALWSLWEGEDSNIVSKCSALESLSYMSNPRVFEAIEKAYQSNKKELRACALVAMGHSLDARWMPVLIKELSSPDETMRLQAADACGEMAQEDLSPHLLPLLQDPQPAIRFAVIESLGKIGGERAEKSLRILIKSEDREIKEAANEALKELLVNKNPFYLPIAD